jgi:hypothetical protein
VAVKVAAVAIPVGAYGEVIHAVNNSRPAQMTRIRLKRALFMPPVYNGFRFSFSTLAQRLACDCSPHNKDLAGFFADHLLVLEASTSN